MSKVSRRGGFSDRNRIKPENTEIQLKEFDSRTRVQLQNMLNKLYSEVYGDIYYQRDYIQEFFRYVVGDIYSEPVDIRTWINDTSLWDMISETILRADYDDVLTLIEAIIQYWDRYLKKTDYEYYNSYNGKYMQTSVFETVNMYFEREYVGYRFVDGLIVPISDQYEVNTVKQALNTKEDVVREHISKANRLLADRSQPDYENSIKESISAVEALCEILTGVAGKEATLGKMLKKLEDNGIIIHSGLKSAFNILYGYTSDANGIRHAGDIGGPSSTFEEAKFMLISCCAFINYLIAVTAD
ncbi:AbiJ-NTD4 domain-containing protein [Lachnospiraceae bacterium YH-ros2228]